MSKKCKPFDIQKLQRKFIPSFEKKCVFQFLKFSSSQQSDVFLNFNETQSFSYSFENMGSQI